MPHRLGCGSHFQYLGALLPDESDHGSGDKPLNDLYGQVDGCIKSTEVLKGSSEISEQNLARKIAFGSIPLSR